MRVCNSDPGQMSTTALWGQFLDSHIKLYSHSALQYLPGIIATLALIMINCIRRDDLAAFDPFDDPSYCR